MQGLIKRFRGRWASMRPASHRAEPACTSRSGKTATQSSSIRIPLPPQLPFTPSAAGNKGMKLGRPPPPVEPPTSTRLRVLKPTPAGPRGSPSMKVWRRADSYFVRMLAGSIGVSVPLFVAVGILVTNFAIQTSTSQASARSQALAQAAALRVDDWVVERQGELDQLAHDVAGRLAGANAVTTAEVQARIRNFDEIAIFDTAGRVVAPSAQTSHVAVTHPAWWAKSLLMPTIQPIQRDAAGLSWLMTSPIIQADRSPEGVVVGDLNIGLLFRLLAPYGGTAGHRRSQ